MLIATAGHVDHGKTTLIKVLTGVETDRLKEEKARGVSIELGFAYLPTPGGQTIGFVDVPGHEKFIRNMAAGISAVDLALVLVAADDGVMPQTREHIAILGLYGIRQVVIVISRADLVSSEERFTTIENDTKALLANSGIECVATHRVSSINGSGIDNLKQELITLSEDNEKEKTNDQEHLLRIAIDRAFSIEGAGTVVTGTVYSGQLNSGDEFVHLPSMNTLRLKKLMVNSVESTQAGPGSRVSLNLGNVSAQQIERGDWIVAPGQTLLSDCIDVELTMLDSVEQADSLKHWGKLHVHCATTSTTARVSFYDRRQLGSGEKAMAQLVLANPIHCVYGDRLILRNSGASKTIAGAEVIDPVSYRYRSLRKHRPETLKMQHHDTSHEALRGLLESEHQNTVGENFRLARNLTPKAYSALLVSLDVVSINQPKSQQETSSKADILLSRERHEQSRAKFIEALQTHHQDFPESAGLLQQSLVDTSGLAGSTALMVIEQLIQDQSLVRSGNTIKLKGFVPELDRDSRLCLDEITTLINADTTKPPSLSALVDNTNLSPADFNSSLAKLVKAGYLVQVSEKRFYHPDAIKALSSLAKQLDEENDNAGFDAKTFRDRSGIGRNITIEVLEYMDATGFTRRLGDRRVWNPRS